MKNNIIRISLSVFFCCIGVFFAILSHNKVKGGKPIRFDGDIDETTDVIVIDDDDIKTIDNYTVKEVLGISLGKVTTCKSFEVRTTGTSTASGVNVKIANYRVIKDNEAFIECVSKSSFLDMGTNGSQRFFSGDKIALRKTSKVSDEAVATFDNDDVEIINNDEYITRYGWLPYQMNGYVINDNTYLEDPTMKKNDDDTYTILVKLDPNSNAAFYYKREVATNASATKEPVFKEIKFEITIDSNFVIQKVKSYEKYDVTVYAIFAEMTSETVTECTDTYNYDNVSFDVTLYNYYKSKITQ